MAVKTITIDMDAYETLRRLKRPGQSFSQVIKEQLGSRGLTGADVRRLAAALEPRGEETHDELDRVIDERKRHPIDVPEL